MTREIKFRVWDRTHNEMFFIDDIWRLRPSKFLENMKAGHGELMQFTGLKDKNGKEIYESDIVKFRSHPAKQVIGEVVYAQEWGQFRVSYQDAWSSFQHYNTLEIIGNIYENPELLSK